MAKIDKIKETLNSLRVGLSIISAFIITLGGVLGNLYNKEIFGLLFWLTTIIFFIFLISGFIIIHTIRLKTDEIEEL